MPLKLVKRPKTPNWVMRGTVRRQSIEESTGTSDKRLAQEIMDRRLKELLETSIYGKTETLTFAQAVVDYMEHGAAADRFLAPVLEHFGTTLLRDVDQHAIDVAAKKLYPKAGAATRNRQVYTPISTILHHAARKGWCPAPVIQRPKQPRGVTRWLRAEEAERLIAECSTHLRPLVVFLIYTGARAGEAVWLDWRSIDVPKRQVTFPKTKNGDSRSVPLHPRALEELLALGHRDGAVFRTPAGQPYSRPAEDQDADTSAGSRIKTAFTAACRRAGLGWQEKTEDGKSRFVTDVTPHVCRHTFATWHYRENRDFTALQKLGGWKTPAMVFRYAHTNVSEHADSIGRLPWGKSGEPESKDREEASEMSA